MQADAMGTLRIAVRGLDAAEPGGRTVQFATAETRITAPRVPGAHRDIDVITSVASTRWALR